MLIYIVEDDKNIREIEGYALRSSGYEVEEFEEATSFYLAMEKRIPELIILDIMLPNENGLTILKKLRSETKTQNVPIMMVTAKTTELDKVKGLDAGADDYITKPFGVMELISRVKALLRRAGGHENKQRMSYQNVSIDEDKHVVYVGSKPCELTYKEFELLKYLLQNQGIVLSRNKILEYVWGFDYEGETRTVDVHIRTLRQKLGEAGQMIKTVRNVGYKVGE